MAGPVSNPSPSPTAGSPWRRGAVVLILAAVAASGWYGVRRWNPGGESDPFPLHVSAPSPFLNTRPDARYVGSAACVSCHKEEHASFHRTGMGSSMGAVDLGREPADGAFEHPRSQRRYEVTRKDGALWHRELLLTPREPKVVLAEYPVKYVVGSGRHSLTYLVETDGFLVESPATWYASRRAWDISPGYDEPNQAGFARPVGEGCLFCHAGQAEAIRASAHRMRIGEPQIGCERCHGPGSLHVERRTTARDVPAQGEIDYTIVNPIYLGRELAEAVCQQCHLNSDATATLRGRKLTDFRPGQRWEDFHEVYVIDGDEAGMTVVGHVQQMHLSRCYQGAKTFSCLTCHDPHDEPAPADRAAHYKRVCLDCHRTESCTVSGTHRQQVSPTNDCVQCHMPRTATDIPHLSFTHHRVGIHRAAPAADPDALPPDAELRPFLENRALSEIDRKLALGQAYRALSLRDKDIERRARWRTRALQLLTEVREAGLRDGSLDAAMAQLAFDTQTGDAQEYAQSALAHPELAGQARCDALFVLAQTQAARGNHAAAVAALRDLTGLRRHAFDWLFLATYTRALGDEDAAREALQTAVRINPRQANAHRYLADYYRKQGDGERADWHQQRASP